MEEIWSLITVVFDHEDASIEHVCEIMNSISYKAKNNSMLKTGVGELAKIDLMLLPGRSPDWWHSRSDEVSAEAWVALWRLLDSRSAELYACCMQSCRDSSKHLFLTQETTGTSLVLILIC